MVQLIIALICRLIFNLADGAVGNIKTEVRINTLQTSVFLSVLFLVVIVCYNVNMMHIIRC